METDSRRLFATESLGGRAVYRLQAVTVAAGILLVLYYRATHVPAAGEGRAAWLGMLAVELWYSAYWVITQSVRWSPVRRRPFKDRLAARYVRCPYVSDGQRSIMQKAYRTSLSLHLFMAGLEISRSLDKHA